MNEPDRQLSDMTFDLLTHNLPLHRITQDQDSLAAGNMPDKLYHRIQIFSGTALIFIFIPLYQGCTEYMVHFVCNGFCPVPALCQNKDCNT